MIRTLRQWADAVKRRDGACRTCGATTDLHAHHVKRKSTHPGLALDLNNGETLCGICHGAEHAKDHPNMAKRLMKIKGVARVPARSYGRTTSHVTINGVTLTQKAVAALMGVHLNTVSRMVKRGKYPKLLEEYFVLMREMGYLASRAQALLEGPDRGREGVVVRKLKRAGKSIARSMYRPAEVDLRGGGSGS